ncbi:MAG: hypothetical protein GX061_00180 [Eubacteriaceae bacterium]|nr:hypothetical protein [Eubacteriaceae bacterium]
MKEFKIGLINQDKNFENAEKLMADMSEKGWEVVSVAIDSYSKFTPQLLITFQREVGK